MPLPQETLTNLADAARKAVAYQLPEGVKIVVLVTDDGDSIGASSSASPNLTRGMMLAALATLDGVSRCSLCGIVGCESAPSGLCLECHGRTVAHQEGT
jgi:hypothetical protein